MVGDFLKPFTDSGGKNDCFHVLSLLMGCFFESAAG
jgi:hypothetical protein